MTQMLANNDIRSMGSDCAHSSLYAYFKGTAYYAVSFFRFFYYGYASAPSKRNRQCT